MWKIPCKRTQKGRHFFQAFFPSKWSMKKAKIDGYLQFCNPNLRFMNNKSNSNQSICKCMLYHKYTLVISALAKEKKIKDNFKKHFKQQYNWFKRPFYCFIWHEWNALEKRVATPNWNFFRYDHQIWDQVEKYIFKREHRASSFLNCCHCCHCCCCHCCCGKRLEHLSIC